MNKRKSILLILATIYLTAAAFSNWSDPVPVLEINTEFEEWAPFLSYDGLTLYFGRVRTSDSYYGKIFEAIRDEPTGFFTTIREAPGELNALANAHVLCPWVSCDNLRMYYNTQESGVGWRLKFSQRASIEDPWPQGTDITELNNMGKYLTAPKLTGDELVIFFQASDMTGGIGKHDIWMATRTDRNMSFEYIRNLTEINTSSNEAHPNVSPDGLTLYFTSNRNGFEQIFKAARKSRNEPFSNIKHLSFFDTDNGHSALSCITSDGNVLYFVRSSSENRSTQDIYVSYYLGNQSLYKDELSTGFSYEIIGEPGGNK